jgi:holo-[acyl-carrier protein] synthase
LAILCGVDIVEIDRIQRSLEAGNAFRDRVFTLKEIEYCEARKGSKYKSYAARFAAKEAVSKAFGTGIGSGVEWKSIEVLNDDRGKPFVHLHGKARDMFEEMGGRELALSLSHSDHYAVAYAVMETERRN